MRAVDYPESKRATPEHPIADVLARRFSPRAFAPDVPSDAQLARLFTAACWAPSAGNGQPWRMVVGVHGDDVWPVVLGCLNEKNQAWCRHVPVLGIAIAQTLRDDKPLKTGPFDLGQAMADLTVQATTEGLYVHQMAGFSEEAARDAFAVPAGFTPWTAFAIGSLGHPETLPDDLKARELAPRHRHPLAERVFGRRFGEPRPFGPTDGSGTV
jgi:nitroreductase